MESSYDEIKTNITLFSETTNRKVAEIDLLAQRDDGACDAFEVKCSYRKVKAKKQLRKIKKLLPEVKRTYFFCGESGNIEIIRS